MKRFLIATLLVGCTNEAPPAAPDAGTPIEQGPSQFFARVDTGEFLVGLERPAGHTFSTPEMKVNGVTAPRARVDDSVADFTMPLADVPAGPTDLTITDGADTFHVTMPDLITASRYLDDPEVAPIPLSFVISSSIATDEVTFELEVKSLTSGATCTHITAGGTDMASVDLLANWSCEKPPAGTTVTYHFRQHLLVRAAVSACTGPGLACDRPWVDYEFLDADIDLTF